MNYGRWFAVRGPRFILQRGARLVRRYGLSSDVAVDRILGCLDTLARFGCAPTFPTPGVVAQRYPEVIRRIQDAGAEIAVHSYHHVDLSALSLPAAVAQLERAVQTFERLGIDVRGFRCPYLGWSDQLLNSLPPGMFEYSSNEAVRFEPDNSSAAAGGEFYSKLEGFYRGKAFSDTVCLPSTRPNFIEIPACVPDDLQLHDGLGLGPEGIADVWGEMFDQIHGRGELFTLLFHPELGAFCEAAFATLLGRASRSSVPVWFARLRDVSEWWREKAAFRVEAGETDAGLRLSFDCSPRATVLAKGLQSGISGRPWDGEYFQIRDRTLTIGPGPRPFVGVPPSASPPTTAFLREQGYLVETGDSARRCAIYLDTGTLEALSSAQLVRRIESFPGPLVRFWRWPNGAKSALCVTGDLDALTLVDYVGRLVAS